MGSPILSIAWGYQVQNWQEDGCLAEVTNSVSWRKLLTTLFQIELLICYSRCGVIMMTAVKRDHEEVRE